MWSQWGSPTSSTSSMLSPEKRHQSKEYNSFKEQIYWLIKILNSRFRPFFSLKGKIYKCKSIHRSLSCKKLATPWSRLSEWLFITISMIIATLGEECIPGVYFGLLPAFHSCVPWSALLAFLQPTLLTRLFFIVIEFLVITACFMLACLSLPPLTASWEKYTFTNTSQANWYPHWL